MLLTLLLTGRYSNNAYGYHFIIFVFFICFFILKLFIKIYDYFE